MSPFGPSDFRDGPSQIRKVIQGVTTVLNAIRSAESERYLCLTRTTTCEGKETCVKRAPDDREVTLLRSRLAQISSGERHYVLRARVYIINRGFGAAAQRRVFRSR